MGADMCPENFRPKVQSFQGQSGLVKMPNGGPRYFDRRWATCLGSRELQSWAGQAARKKGGPPCVKVAHECGNGRYAYEVIQPSNLTKDKNVWCSLKL